MLFLKVLLDDAEVGDKDMERGAAVPIRRALTRTSLAIEKGEARGRATNRINSSSRCVLLRRITVRAVGAVVVVVRAIMVNVLAVDEPMMNKICSR
jgi:hypothetical protein